MLVLREAICLGAIAEAHAELHPKEIEVSEGQEESHQEEMTFLQHFPKFKAHNYCIRPNPINLSQVTIIS